MKKIIAGILVIGILACTQTGANGQQTAPYSGTLLAKPTSAQWQLTVLQKAADAASTDSQPAPAAAPQSFEVRSIVVQGKIRHEEDKAANGGLFTIWCLGTMEFYKCPPHDKFLMCSPSDEQFYVVKPGLLFGELAWITKNKFLGKKNIDGKICLVFGEPSQALSPDDLASLLEDETSENGQYKPQTLNRLAYVDENTHLPVYSQDNKAIYLYQFGPPPQGNLTVPPEILAMLKFRDEQARKLSVQPGKS
jgi:hypothetical protein